MMWVGPVPGNDPIAFIFGTLRNPRRTRVRGLVVMMTRGATQGPGEAVLAPTGGGGSQATGGTQAPSL